MGNTESRAPPATLHSQWYLRYVLGILFLAHTLNFVDRQIINILAHPIQKDLGLSDTQLGLLTGLAFALFYALLGVPIARYADRPTSHRPTIIAVSLLIWSGMTALCGLAQSFIQLALARVGVGIGEAGCTPPALSLIADHFGQERRASAIAIYGMGLPFGGLLGMVIGGLLADSYGWRTALFAVGVPGIVLGAVLALTVRDPRRHHPVPASTSTMPAASLKQGLGELLKIRSFRYLLAGVSLITMLSYGKTTWATILFARVHGLTPGQIGLTYGVMLGIAGMLGTWSGGWLGDKYGQRDPRYFLSIPVIGIVATTPLLILGYLEADWRVSLALLLIPSIAGSLHYGPTFAVLQNMVDAKDRATAVAIMLLAANLIGAGLGPLLFGVLSDFLEPTVGVKSVRWVLVVAALIGVGAALMLLQAARFLEFRSDKVAYV